MARAVERPGIRERLSYRFDRFMERGTIALIVGLFAISVVIVVGIVLVLVLIGGTNGNDLPDLVWMSMLRTLDPGTMGGDTGYPFVFGMLAITFAGIFIISTLIGILNTGLQDKLADLRKGRSRVLERDHVVILGWSQQVFPVITELLAGGTSRSRNSIVVLADRDRIEMEAEIRDRVKVPRRARIVCRSGRSSSLADLRIVNPDEARAIVILQNQGEDPDVEVLKTILALTGRPDRREAPYRIVAEVRDKASAGIARLIAGDEVRLLLADELVSRIIAQTSRQSGLSSVYLELLDFAGDEFHVAALPELTGRTFAEAVQSVTAAIPVGLVRDGTTRLVPPGGETLRDGDRLVLLTADHDSARVAAEPAPVDRSAIRDAEPDVAAPERLLILGWNRHAAAVVRELDPYVPPGSQLLAVSPLDRITEANRLIGLTNLRVAGRMEATTNRPALDALDIPSYHHVIVLCESDDRDWELADARTLLTLLHLRDIQATCGGAFTIVSEMIDEADRELAEISQADDFIVSSRLLSLLLAQIAETPELADVFGDLFDAEGCEVYLREAGCYVEPGRELTFATLQAAALDRGEVALGYRLMARSRDAASAYGVVLNPGRDAVVTFTEADRVVVLAEG